MHSTTKNFSPANRPHFKRHTEHLATNPLCLALDTLEMNGLRIFIAPFFALGHSGRRGLLGESRFAKIKQINSTKYVSGAIPLDAPHEQLWNLIDTSAVLLWIAYLPVLDALHNMALASRLWIGRLAMVAVVWS
ncbi:predicted protein [Histoplasma capsulatum G186AR]|uniref:Uncharacterized protein n=1 Tax=Ajellomyces capsulatus (strain G186AR / H82 / ATCC MYA-2454 / RMSCC 2432) TaxID=447093 RepID=C0NFL3_AJECG|nr:uncharacterized protein HCBG_01679 [Histoplasma capsulatum G186AR]EEH10034.1 predicted protein [Histoplasma capsulatum G186AR]